MTKKTNLPKKKNRLIGPILASVFLSFLILYVLAVCLWILKGYESSAAFFLSLLKANQISVTALQGSFWSQPFFISLGQKMGAFMQEAHLADKAQNLSQTGADALKDGLSGFVEEDLIMDALAEGAGFLNAVYVFFLKAGALFIFVLKIFLLKAFLLIAAIPLFALLGAVGLIDGLSQREIRRAELGRESSYLFHMLNKWIAKIIGVGLCVWVCTPVAVNPQWFFVPLGLLFSMMLSLSASRFKKYL